MSKQPKLSICIPYHDIDETAFFLKRNIDSIMQQTFTDYEIVLTKEGKMAENTNASIKKARGEIIKIQYLDDFLSHASVLGDIVEYFNPHDDWMILGAHNNLSPHFTDDVKNGNNKLGSPSALVFRNYFAENILFDETLSWLLDGDLYHRLHERYGLPKILPGNRVTIGEGPHQMTYLLSDEEKLVEHEYMIKKYEK